MRKHWWLAAALAVPGVAAPARAQEAVRYGAVEGVVRDASTSAPVAGAVVAIPELRLATRTDSAGAFRFERVREGTHEWRVTALGYLPLQQEMESRAGDRLTVGIIPHALQLEGVTVNVGRVERSLRVRRNAAPVAVEQIVGDDLLRTGAVNAEELVRSQAGVRICTGNEEFSVNDTWAATGRRVSTALPANPGDMQLSSGYCIWSRGRYLPVRLYIDDQPALGGMLDLLTFHPADLYAMEVWGYGVEVRLFTLAFMERVARGDEELGSPVRIH